MNGSMGQLVTILLTVINLLSIILIGGISFFIKSLWSDMKTIRSEVTALQTEHNIYRKMCAKHCIIPEEQATE